MLPESLIAQSPLPDRAASRLLHLERRTGAFQHRAFRDVPGLLAPGDLLVLNDTRVTALRLIGKKLTGARVEALLLHPTGREAEFTALVRPGKRLPPGTEVVLGDGLGALVGDDLGDGRRLLRFADPTNLAERLSHVGTAPLPPYIHEELADAERYQTVYARNPGSAAAPTAGLHFTPELIDAVRARGVKIATVTLDVGIDTFRPVQSEDLSQHTMHGERCSVPPETAEAVKTCEGRIIAVGTTAVRTLESLAAGPRHVMSGEVATQLFIRPGFEYRIVDGMFTNFHMPRTSMLMMISALAGREAVFAAYEAAIRERYRFLSVGDSMLIL